MSRTFNQKAFQVALEQSRASRSVSWRKVAQDTGIEDWLGVGMETFFDGPAPTVTVRTGSHTVSVEVNCAIPESKIEALHQVVEHAVDLARLA